MSTKLVEERGEDIHTALYRKGGEQYTGEGLTRITASGGKFASFLNRKGKRLSKCTSPSISEGAAGRKRKYKAFQTEKKGL